MEIMNGDWLNRVLGVDSFSNSKTYYTESIEDNYIETVSKLRGLILNSIQLGIHIIMQLNRLLKPSDL